MNWMVFCVWLYDCVDSKFYFRNPTGRKRKSDKKVGGAYYIRTFSTATYRGFVEVV